MKAAKAISINHEKHLRAVPSIKTSLKSTITKIKLSFSGKIIKA